MKVISIVCCIILLILLGCERGGSVESRQERRNGINGEAVYIFNKEGSIISMFKKKYSIQDYTILMDKDTIQLGEDFGSTLLVTSDKYKITINQPIHMEILSGDDSKGYDDFIFTPIKEGVFDYAGIIEFDSVIAPFEYKFIVVRKK